MERNVILGNGGVAWTFIWGLIGLLVMFAFQMALYARFPPDDPRRRNLREMLKGFVTNKWVWVLASILLVSIVWMIMHFLFDKRPVDGELSSVQGGSSDQWVTIGSNTDSARNVTFRFDLARALSLPALRESLDLPFRDNILQPDVVLRMYVAGHIVPDNLRSPFGNWKQAYELRKEGNAYERSLDLPYGKYEYKYVALKRLVPSGDITVEELNMDEDARDWTRDPTNSTVSKSTSRNSILLVTRK